MEIPQTLHGQLYLLAFDRKRHRFDGDNLWYFGRALRAAMLTDLYLSGYLKDTGGRPYPSGDLRPANPILLSAFAAIGTIGRMDWRESIAPFQKEAPQVVRNELVKIGWLRVHRRMSGLISDRVALCDEDMVGMLADRVTESLRNAVGGLSADPRLLALGLLGVNGQLPTVLSSQECSRYRQELSELTLAAAGPILGLRQSIEATLEGTGRRNASALWRISAP